MNSTSEEIHFRSTKKGDTIACLPEMDAKIIVLWLGIQINDLYWGVSDVELFWSANATYELFYFYLWP